MKEENAQVVVEEQIAETNVETTNVEETTNGKLSYDKIIRKLITSGCKRINNIRVKNVNFTDKDNYTMVSFTIDKGIRGMVNENGGFKEGITTTIFTSLYAIAGALKEDEEYGWLANALLENPKALNLIFNGSTIDVLQQEVVAGEAYYNPFSNNENAIPQVFDHDTFINNVIKFKLGKTGQRMADTLAVKMMGF